MEVDEVVDTQDEENNFTVCHQYTEDAGRMPQGHRRTSRHGAIYTKQDKEN